MRLEDLANTGLRALSGNRMRSALTVLGIVVGVAAVIATLAVGQGASESVRAQIRQLGANTLTIMPGTVRMGPAMGGAGGGRTLTPEDATAIARECSAVAAVAPSVRTSAQLVVGSQNWNTQIEGTTAAIVSVRRWALASGRFLTDADVRGASKVVVLGATVAKELFGGSGAGATGQQVRLRGIPFRVVGVLVAKGGQGPGGDQDDVAFVPLTTAQRRLMGVTHIGSITVSAVSEARSDEAQAQITALLRQRHHLRADEDADFSIFSQQEIANTMGSVTRMLTLLLAAVAAVSLLVGGIGIMNIMLVSVTERTREIGIRRAMGARRHDILSQFLIEATALSLAGGILGVLTGILASALVAAFANWPVVVQPGGVLLACSFATLIGLFFGWYPAQRAARLDPMEALRYE
jgi:putative ABC transport system permease protein